MKNIEVIGMPMKYGCFLEGVDLSYTYLKDSLEKVLEVKCNNEVDTSYDNPVMHLNDKKLKYVEPVMEINNRLYKHVYKSLEDGNFPLIIGGDHSQAIGSISAALDYYKGDISVIYIDKHGDIHTQDTSPSGNLHGIPLSVCIGRCDERFNIGTYKLQPENLYYIGLCNYEIEEIDYINNAGITAFMAFEVEEKKAEWIVKQILSKINTKNVHISFDLDCIKPSEFEAVNVSIQEIYQDNNGLSFKTVKKILELLLKNTNVVSMDLVEYNPLRDTDFKCRDKVEEILEVIKRSGNNNDNS